MGVCDYLLTYISVQEEVLSGIWFAPGDIALLLKFGPAYLIHAVSVGEVMSVRRLIEELRKAYPGKKFVISTVTPTGNRVAHNFAKEGDFVTYLPLDIGFIVKRVIGRIGPSLFIIAETEIWPNLISCLYKNNIPIIIVNGRISDKSFQGYSKIKFLLKPILNKISLFCAQTSTDSQRLIQLGLAAEKIRISGNMKFDLESAKPAMKLPDLKLKPGEKLLVCGSTHSGEEEKLFVAYYGLLGCFSNLKLLIAPRHPERSKRVARLASRAGLRAVLISSLTPDYSPEVPGKPAVFILDTIGQLVSFYAIADIVFIGGSLIKRGGHNLLEPASFGKPVLFGPYMFNFRDIAELFLTHQAAILVHDKEELRFVLEELLIDFNRAEEMGRRAKELVLKNTGSTEKNLRLIEKLLSSLRLNLTTP